MKACIVASFFIAACPDTRVRCDEPAAPGHEWVVEYGNLGGDAYLWPPEHRTIGIAKLSGRKKSFVPLVGLKAPAGITSIILQGFEIGDADMIAIAQWKDIETLEIIDGKSVTDKGLKAISRMPVLKNLAMRDTAITGEGVTALSGSKSLVDLTISSTVIPCRIRRICFKELPSLERLTLNVEGVEAVELANLPKLKEIIVFPTTLTSATVRGLDSLTELDFQNSLLKKLTVGSTPKLQTLDVRNTRMEKMEIYQLQLARPSVTIRR